MVMMNIIIIIGFLERPSTAQGGSTGCFTITLNTHTHTHTHTHTDTDTHTHTHTHLSLIHI